MIHRRAATRAFYVAVAIELTGCAASSASRSVSPSASDPAAAAIAARLASRLPALIDSAGIPGMAVAVITNRRIEWIEGFGVRSVSDSSKVDANTVFEGASLSKPVLAYAALKLVDAGKLDLDRPLTEYMPNPDLKDVRGSRITARMVLNHTTGLQNERIGNDTLALAFDPGTRFRYSGEGYYYLGETLAHIEGMSFADFMEKTVFAQLGMRRTSYQWEPRFDSNAASGHGAFGEPRRQDRSSTSRGVFSLRTTAYDYGLFLVAVLKGTGLRPGTRKLLVTPSVPVTPEIGWALGFSLEPSGKSTNIWHHGDNSLSGFTGFMLADTERDIGFVYFANSTTGLSIVHEMLAGFDAAPHASAAWINYERYDAPARVARVALERKGAREGADSALALYQRLKLQQPADVSSEGLLNTLGYRMLELKRPIDAVAFFERNAQLFPHSANVYDSLGDGYAAAGQPDDAIAAYRRSVALDPSNTHALQAIRDLQRLR
jgi:CubicO group peptidase (beta-lactamase class C family)